MASSKKRPQSPVESAQLPSTEAISAVLDGPIAAVGASLEGVVAKRAGSRILVRVAVDLPHDRIGSMSLDEVAIASRAVSDSLDASDLFPGAYTLEVSTPGTSRPLTLPHHFKRARTRLVELSFTTGEPVLGRLVEVSADDDPVLTLEPGGQFRLSQVRRGRIEVELSRVDELNDDDFEPLDGADDNGQDN